MRFSTVINLLFPPRCLNCRKNAGSGIALCGACAKSVRLNQSLFCGKCRARLPSVALPVLRSSTATEDGAKEGLPTIKRICHRDFPYILGAATEYDTAAVKNLIHDLKFRYIKDAAKPLAEFLVEYIESRELTLQGYIAVPLPLSAKRLRQREFNQSELVAGIFAARFGLPLETKILLRTKHGKPQSETKSVIERKENIKGCFAVNRLAPNVIGAVVKDPEPLRGKNIVLIDDVTTSGATLFEAASVLKSAGAKKILALTVAKA